MKDFLKVLSAVALVVLSAGCDLLDPGKGGDPPDPPEPPIPSPVIKAEITPGSPRCPNPDHEYWVGTEVLFCGEVNTAKAKFHLNGVEWDVTPRNGRVEIRKAVDEEIEAAFMVAYNSESSDTLWYELRQMNPLFLNESKAFGGRYTFDYWNAAGNRLAEAVNSLDPIGWSSLVNSGTQIAYVKLEGERNGIYFADLDGRNAVKVTDGFTTPFSYGRLVTVGSTWIFEALEIGTNYPNLYISENGSQPRAMYQVCRDEVEPACNSGFARPVVSPDGYVYFVRYIGSDRKNNINPTAAIDRYEPRTRQTVNLWQSDGTTEWPPSIWLTSASEKHVLGYSTDLDGSGKGDIFLIPTSGGQPKVIDGYQLGSFSPDKYGSFNPGELFVTEIIRTGHHAIMDLDGNIVHQFRNKAGGGFFYQNLIWLPADPTARAVFQIASTSN